MQCPSCSTECIDGSRFCAQCGTRLPLHCWSCGVEVRSTAVYCPFCGVNLSAQPESWSGHISTNRRPERRQVTIMFCDLVGYTALSRLLDPEDLLDVMQTFRDVVTNAVKKHGGFVASHHGDGMLIYFGYPRAHESDAEHAVRAGLAIVESLGDAKSPHSSTLQSRIGIATGIAVIGQVIGEGISREEAVTGHTPNLAARLQSIAPPDGIIISESTKRLIGDVFECIALGTHPLKGIDEPVPAWRALGERRVGDRMVVRRALPSPMRGRDNEFHLLTEMWNLGCSGVGHAVVVTGEPGIGKSRLAQALYDYIPKRSRIAVRYYAAERYRNSAFYPVIEHIERAADLQRHDSATLKLRKLESLLKLFVDDGLEVAKAMPYLASLLLIPLDGIMVAPDGSPEQIKEHTLRLLRDLLLRLSLRKPVLLLCEDLQWADPSTLEWIGQLVEDLPRSHIFLLAMARPEFSPPWSGRPNTLTLELPRLNQEYANAILQYVVGEQSLPQTVQKHILGRSDGIPLFVEELTRSALEADFGSDDARRASVTAAQVSVVPSTLHDSLMARLDRLSTVKEVAQISAAIGREFSFELLLAVIGVSSLELTGALQRLLNAGIIQAQGKAHAEIYVFKHALIQDAAYTSMLRGRREPLHARIATVLETSFPGSRPELLAHHWRISTEPVKAIPYLQTAGAAAAGRAAHAEAAKHYGDALSLLTAMPDDAARYGIELSLQVGIGLSVTATRGYGAPEVEVAYRRARDLCDMFGNGPQLFPVIRGLWPFYTVRGRLNDAMTMAQQCMRMAQASQVPEHLIEAHTAMGYTLTYLGDFLQGKTHLLRAVELYDGSDGDNLSYPTPQNPKMACLSLLVIVSWMCGEAGLAKTHAKTALEMAQRMRRPFDLAYVHCFLAMYGYMRGDPAAALQHGNTAKELSSEHHFAGWAAVAHFNVVLARGALGEIEQAAEQFPSALTAWRASGAELNRSSFLGGYAETLARAGRLQDAVRTLEEGIAHAREHREGFFLSMLLHGRGALLLALGPDRIAEGEAALQEALSFTRTQGSRLFEFRTLGTLHLLASQMGHPTKYGEALLCLAQELAKCGYDGDDVNQVLAAP